MYYYEGDEIYDYLTKGIELRFAQMPVTDKTSILLADLKKYGFVSADTQIEHFMVLFGIPLHINSTPFEPIKWRKNKQLYRFFVYELFPKETIWRYCFVIHRMFANKHGEDIFMPESDKKRLTQSNDYDTLCKILKDFKG